MSAGPAATLDHFGRVIGRVRLRLAAMLREAGWRCDARDLWPQRGAWRTNVRLDVLAWEGAAVHPDGYKVSIGSWEPMSLLIARGFTWSDPKSSLSGRWELHAKAAP